MVTSGAASALTLGTAAVLTGTDRQKIADLPDLAGMKSEVIIQKAHRFGYERAVRNCGVRLVEVETREDLERAVSDKTAMMLFYNNNNKEGRIQDEEFVQLGKKHSIPTLNDAAADVPPVENLWKYTAMGFDLVAFSGGKGIRGPQSAGLLLGKKPLIAAARQNGSPNGNAIGRGMKVNKEEMVGMLAALELFVGKDHAREGREFERRAEEIRKSAAAVAGVKAEVFVPEVANHVPHVRVTWDRGRKVSRPAAVVRAMQDGEPSIAIRAEGEALVIGVWMMQAGRREDRRTAAASGARKDKLARVGAPAGAARGAGAPASDGAGGPAGRSPPVKKEEDTMIGRAALCLALGLLFATNAGAQLASQTALVGTVTDSGNLVIPGAQVVAVNVGTKDTYEATTNAEGYYNIQFVRTGTYEITVTVAGFQTFKASGVEVANNQVVRTNAVLKVGGITESVNVEAAAMC